MRAARRRVLAALAGVATGLAAPGTVGARPQRAGSRDRRRERRPPPRGDPRTLASNGADGYEVGTVTAHGRNQIDELTDLVALSTGGYVTVGHTLAGPGRDVWLVRTAATGSEHWDETFGPAGPERAYAAVEDLSGDVVVAGTSAIPRTDPAPLFLRVRLDGSVVARSRDTGGPPAGARALAPAADGNHRFLGWERDEDEAPRPSVRRFSPAGEVVARRRVDGVAPGSFTAAAPAGTGDCLAVGWTRDGDDVSALAVRLDGTDGVRWRREPAFEADAVANDVLALPDGGHVVCGSIEGGPRARGWLLRFDAAGRERWRRVLAGPGRRLRRLARAPDGGIVFGGLADADGSSALLGGVDDGGVLQWAGTFGPSLLAAVSGVDARADGTLVAAGNTLFGQYGQDGYLLTLRPSDPAPVASGTETSSPQTGGEPTPTATGETATESPQDPVGVGGPGFGVVGGTAAVLGAGLSRWLRRRDAPGDG